MRQLRVTLQHVHPRWSRALRRVHARLHAVHGGAAAAGPPHRGRTWHMREVRATLQRVRHGGPEQVRHVRPAPHARRAHGAARRGARVRALRHRLPQVLRRRWLQDVPPLTPTLELSPLDLQPSRTPAPQHLSTRLHSSTQVTYRASPTAHFTTHLLGATGSTSYSPMARASSPPSASSAACSSWCLYHIRLQPALHTVATSTTYGCSHHTVAASITHGCSLYHMLLQPPSHTVTASTTQCYILYHIRLQPLLHTAAASATYDCSLYHARLQVVL